MARQRRCATDAVGHLNASGPMPPLTDSSSRKCRCPPSAPRTSAEMAASCASSSWRRPGW
eukprot:9451730-Pyramimonas_sp.AAC.1